MRIGRHCLAGILRYKSARRVSPCMLESIIIEAEEEISMGVLESIIIQVEEEVFLAFSQEDS
jgi:hypothetical protein